MKEPGLICIVVICWSRCKSINKVTVWYVNDDDNVNGSNLMHISSLEDEWHTEHGKGKQHCVRSVCIRKCERSLLSFFTVCVSLCVCVLRKIVCTPHQIVMFRLLWALPLIGSQPLHFYVHLILLVSSGFIEAASAEWEPQRNRVTER